MITIKDKKRCNGCHACYNVCPVNFKSTSSDSYCLTMETDSEGFRYPIVDEIKCINCKACLNVCPLLNEPYESDITPKAFACYNRNEKVRMESSSGGVFTLFAEKIIDEGGMVFGASWTGEFALEHTFASSKSDLSKFRGSKYLQSRIGDSFIQVLEFLERGKKVLFSGTPCQVGGLRAFLENKPQKYDEENLICLDFICHGVPSPKVWKKYKAEMEHEQVSKMVSADFRRKESGWKLVNTRFEFENDKVKAESLNVDKYMQAFLRDICLRPSCHDCDFKTKHRLSDITMADFWGIQNVLPEMDDDKGTSLIAVHSAKGSELFNGLNENIVSQVVDFDQAIKFNPSMIKSVPPHAKREKYFENLDKKSLQELHNKFIRKPFIVRIINKVKFFTIRVLRKLRLDNVIKTIIKRK